VVEAKGIYSIEKFIIARRLMYWQVYLHKAVISAEKLLIHILSRAKEIASEGGVLFCSPALREFLYNNYDARSFAEQPEVMQAFSQLDDNDIFLSCKVWQQHEDRVLSLLCTKLVNRDLYRIALSEKPFSEAYLSKMEAATMDALSIHPKHVHYFAFTGKIANNAYNPKSDKIKLLYKDGSTSDIAKAADQLNISVLSTPVEKYYLCFPKQLAVNN
jgi:hypothetical protein